MTARPQTNASQAQPKPFAVAQAKLGGGPRRGAWITLRRNPMAMAGLFGLALLFLATSFAPQLAPYKPNKLDYDHLLQPPSALHVWGTDDLGRDVLSRVLWGGRESLLAGFVAVVIGMTGGVVIGLVSGYSGGLLDSSVQRLSEIAMAFPTVLLVLSIVAVLGPGLTTALVAIGLASIPGYTRLVRGLTLVTKNLDYVTAARMLGASGARIMFCHILPNILAPIIIYSTVSLGSAILLTAGLSYIGLGAQPPSPEWGAMLNYGRDYLRDAWWMSVFPGLGIFVVVLCVNLLGDGLRDALDPRPRA